VRNRVLEDVRSSSSHAAEAALRYRILADRAVPDATRNVTASEAAYAVDRIDFLTLIDARRMLLSRELERERALADYTSHAADLEASLGGGQAP
jgi:outer membrane protein TolC